MEKQTKNPYQSNNIMILITRTTPPQREAHCQILTSVIDIGQPRSSLMALRCWCAHRNTDKLCEHQVELIGNHKQQTATATTTTKKARKYQTIMDVGITAIN